MGRNADFTAIHGRTLNTSKGPAVQATRIQCDKELYPKRLQNVASRCGNLTILQGSAEKLLVKNGKVRGIELSHSGEIYAKAVVLCAGTFLGGTIHIGDRKISGGRIGEGAIIGISDQISKFGHEKGRLKTGTPPRIHKNSVNYEDLKIQPSDRPMPLFSADADDVREMFHEEHRKILDQDFRSFYVEHCGSESVPWVPGTGEISCYLTETNEITHGIIEKNLNKSAMYGGHIEGTGVRYCPSIEDKIIKFRGRSSHHVFIEPEGRDTTRIYPNGTSNSLPESVQIEMIHSIKGLERAVFLRPGYAIEYDFFSPSGLRHSLESKNISGLFMAGQINGTTGYEEAAAQGFMAGVNAVFFIRNEPEFILRRDEAYIGVLIDDLVIKGTEEPYRMFTSRAEYRLLLRQDNARYRLLEHADRLGITVNQRRDETRKWSGLVAGERRRLAASISGGIWHDQILKRPEVGYEELPGARQDLPVAVRRQVEVQVKYEGYIEIERARARKFSRNENETIPSSFDYHSIKALRFEAREKLSKIRPETVGQAGRISGVNPSDIALVTMWLHRMRQTKSS